MGQYFSPCFLNDTKDKVVGCFFPLDFKNGMKLIEHSYIGTNVVEQVVAKIADNPLHLVWAGDYADFAIPDYSYFDLASNDKKWDPLPAKDVCDIADKFTIFVNHDKKQWFDVTKQKIPAFKDWDGIFHPLPILTADGNGGSGGDYNGSLMHLVGSWKCDLIEAKTEAPEGYEEIHPCFTEMTDKEIEEWEEKEEKE